jgi:gliding motility-associated-like protein
LSDGNLAVVGMTNSFGANAGSPYRDMYVLKIDGSDGSVIWSRTFGISGVSARAYDVVENEMGGITFTGTIFHSPTVANWAPLIQLDADGNLIDADFYGLENRNTLGIGLNRSAEGGYIISGSTNILGIDWFDARLFPFVIKTEADGNLLWGSVMEGTPNASGLGGIAYSPVDNGDTIAVAVETYFYQNTTSDPTKRILYLLDADDGVLLNARQYNSEGGQFPKLKAAPDGGYLMSAFTDENNGSGPDDQWWVGPIVNKLDATFFSGCNETDRTSVTIQHSPNWMQSTDVVFDAIQNGAEVFAPIQGADTFSLDLPVVETFCEALYEPTVSFLASFDDCRADTVAFSSQLSLSGYESLVWEFGDGSTLEDVENPVHVYAGGGSFEVILTVFYCETVIEARQDLVLEPVLVEAVLDVESNGCLEEPVLFNLSLSGDDYDELSWDLGDDTVVEDATTFEHTYSEAGAYLVNLTVSYCNTQDVYSSIINLEVCDPLEEITCENLFPNAFSPNNDGVNDEFCVLQPDYPFVSTDLAIFNRWGQEVFRSNEPEKCWDGRVNGMRMNSDVYVYFFQAQLPDGETLLCYGDVTLIL